MDKTGFFCLFKISLCIFVLATGCVGRQLDTLTANGGKGEAMPVYTNSTDMIKAGAGDTFAIRLPSNPTTGYQWQMDELPSDAPVQVRTHDFEPPDSKLLGAGGHERWVFDTKHPGNIDLAFKYVRPWEPENVVRQHVFKVEIK